MSKNYCILLFSGIGNIIQSLPFAFEMKRRYGRVTAFTGGRLAFPESKNLVINIFDQIYPSRKMIPKGYRKLLPPSRGPISEYKAWFIDAGEELPKKFSIDSINYTEMSAKHKVVVWPECQKNWLCKRWIHWEELVSEFEDVALVGLERIGDFKGVTDYRGKLSLLETGGIIRNAEVFIGNEGGISHYSAALGTKTYIIFGCTDPIKNMPPNNAIPISKNLPCQPCQFVNMAQKGTVFYGCEHRKCLKELSVQNVLEVIR